MNLPHKNIKNESVATDTLANDVPFRDPDENSHGSFFRKTAIPKKIIKKSDGIPSKNKKRK